MAGPYNFNSQWKSARNLVLAAASQAAWNGALADASLTRRQRFDGSAILDLTTTRRSDEAYAGKGTAFATDGQVTSYDSKFSGFKAELDSWLAGYLFAFLMGKDTVTGAAAPYTHAFAFDESTRTAVPTTIYMEDTEDVHYKCPDMCMNDITLTIPDIGSVTAEMTMMGTGRQTIGSMAALPALPTNSYLLGSDASLTLNANALIGRHMSTTLKLENQLEVHKAPGGGLYAIFVRKGAPKFSISTQIAAKDVDDTYTLFQNDTPVDFVLNVNSGAAAQLQVTIPVAHFKTTKLGFDKDMVVWQLEADETTCYAQGGNPPITVQVINSVASYLTAA
ncbi:MULTISPECIES: phage tail tube protein [Acidobacterium]|uniref:Uncharacterized protein n=1 Tax=Acidobacterium capsulatum (strain ATCC 51196 / DSM 11244 / BCRC 80197 / JCM 7670 / NBRC 15755 / NCIMB 13165 / 161) TaxID=240015 RepID=C1FA30_ACIC5|nr:MULTISPECIES: phage tail tube protein [Acidobacterium]ACO33821.1 hypothetical protein ACP_0411 [Acidobacterium capsulatum ATCC 51196]HCT62046.1 hypothetical protein [Acidobacterium sp.]